VFDALQEPSDLPLTGFDGSVQASTRAGTIGRHLTGVLYPAAGSHIWNPRQPSYPIALQASPPPPVPVGALASPSPADVWAGFPAPPCGLRLSHVLVDQGCGVGFVTSDS
jgi:hypothetical protein